jgi:hypothetical protein
MTEFEIIEALKTALETELSSFNYDIQHFPDNLDSFEFDNPNGAILIGAGDLQASDPVNQVVQSVLYGIDVLVLSKTLVNDNNLYQVTDQACEVIEKTVVNKSRAWKIAISKPVLVDGQYWYREINFKLPSTNIIGD